MTILDTFYLLFKTDIPQSAGKDIDSLDQKISNLAKKGQQRSESEQKQLKELRKQRLEMTRDLQDQLNVTDKIGNSFIGLTESIVGAFSAYKLFSGIKAGVLNQADINASLQLTSRVTGQNITNLKAVGAAVESVGGNSDSVNSNFLAAFNEASSKHLPLADVLKYYEYINKSIQGLSKFEQNFRLSQVGITDPGFQDLLERTPEEYQRIIDKGTELAQVTSKQGQAALDFKKQMKITNQTLGTTYTILGTNVLPAFTGLLRILQEISTFSNSHPSVGSNIADSLSALPGARMFRKAFEVLSIVGKLPQSGSGGSSKGSTTVGSPSSAQKESMDFWISQGFTPAQAAGIVANEKAETGFKSGVVGDGGRAKGAFQWHPDRRANILAGTGIDVATASHLDQLKAAAWEMKNLGIDSKIRGAGSAEDAAKIFSQQFERPAGGIYEAMRRAQMASSIFAQGIGSAPSIPGASGSGQSISLKIDDINVHTQATDATGISREIGSALKTEIRNTVSNMDDGVKM